MAVHSLLRAERSLSSLIDGFSARVARVERWVQDHFAATVAFVVPVVGLQLFLFREAPKFSTWLLASGWLAFFVGLRAALRLPKQAYYAIERLSSRNVLVGSGTSLWERLSATAETWSRAVSVVTAVSIATVFSAFGGWLALDSVLSGGRMFLGLVAVLVGLVLTTWGAALAGRVVGRAIGLSRLGRWIERGDWEIRVQPGHIDGAAGLKPVGDLYLRQAMLLAIPTIWLAMASIVTRANRSSDSVQYRAYFGLLVVAVALEIAAFVVPMLSFHRIMIREKHRLVLEADQYSERLHTLEHEWPDLTDEPHRRSVGAQAAALRERYLRAEQLPTWPVDASIWRQITLGNVLLLVPVVAQVWAIALNP